MTRAVVYGCGLWLTIACTAMTISSIYMPRWLSSDKEGISIGLHSRYSKSSHTSKPFPNDRLDCSEDPSFCHMWRTVGFLISFDVVVELCTLVAFIVIIAGGVQRRTAGWKIVCSLLLFSSFVQCVGMAIVTHLYNTSSRFSTWHLSTSWNLSTASWSLLLLTSLSIGASARYLPPEGDYELLPSFNNDDLEVMQDEQLLSRIGAWNDGYRRGSGGYQYQNYQDQGSIRSQSIRSEAL